SSATTLEDDPSPATSTKMRVLIVDDHPITRQGMKALVNQQLNLEVCGEADNAAQTLEMVQRLKPDLAILDIALKNTSGIELTKDLKIQAPNLPVLIVSMHDE